MKDDKRIFLGIDVSKGYADFCLLDAGRKPLEAGFQLDDTKEGHLLLKEKLAGCMEAGHALLCALESTGGYERNWLQLLRGMSGDGMEVFHLNPRGVKHYLQTELRRTVTDQVSAKAIALYLISQHGLLREKLEKVKEGKAAKPSSASLVMKLIQGLVTQQTALKNQMEKLIYGAFPELLAQCRSGVPLWALRLLEKHPTALSVGKASVKSLAKAAGVSEKKAEALKKLAAESVAALSDAMAELAVQTLAEEILEKGEKIERLKKQLAATFEHDDLPLLKSVKGIGDWTASALLILTQDVSRFKDASAMASFFGVHPSFHQSGDGRWKARMSKSGNAMMRGVLFMAAINCMLHEPYFKEIYHARRAKGRSHKDAIGVLMHKLLRVIYGMLKSKKPFNRETDERNREKSKQAKGQCPVRERRFQPQGMQAPVSRSQAKKRKAALELDQASNSDASTASPPLQPLLQT